MATSSKVRFDLATLKDQALASIDLRIGQAQDKVDSHHDEEAFARLVAEWRTRQEDRLRAMVHRLDSGEVTDIQLSKFSVDPIPDSGDKWEHRRDKERLDALLVRRGEISAKASSLVAEKDGSISLTKTQLREFFDL